MATIDRQTLKKTVGRHTRLGVTFSWTVAGQDVDLELDGYTVRVWVTDDTTTAGPFDATVVGKVATYQLSTDDLDTETANGGVRVVAVAENGVDTLVSDAREIKVGSWSGAETYTPAP